MKTTFLAGASLLFLGLALPALAATDAEVCKFVKDTAAGFSGKGPHMVDKVTRAEKAVTDCAAKTADFTLSILLESSKLNPGWQDTLKSSWSKTICADKTLTEAVKGGWKVGVTWTTSDKVAYHADTACP
jgi:hypothetical protein